MDYNVCVIYGTVAARPIVMKIGTGVPVLRMLVTVRTERPRRRVDVIPVVFWEPDPEWEKLEKGDRVFVGGQLQRRYYVDDQARRSRMEFVAYQIETNKVRLVKEEIRDAIRSSNPDLPHGG